MHHMLTRVAATGAVFSRLLQLLAARGVYASAALLPAIDIAQRSVEELPRCALLAEYLPGPAQSAAELGQIGGPMGGDPAGDPGGAGGSGPGPCARPGAQASPHSNGAPAAVAQEPIPALNSIAWGMPASVAARMLEDRFRAVCPNTDFKALVEGARRQAADLRVTRSQHARMHVAGAPEAGIVSFVPCSAGPAAGSPRLLPYAVLPVPACPTWRQALLRAVRVAHDAG